MHGGSYAIQHDGLNPHPVWPGMASRCTGLMPGLETRLGLGLAAKIQGRRDLILAAEILRKGAARTLGGH